MIVGRNLKNSLFVIGLGIFSGSLSQAASEGNFRVGAKFEIGLYNESGTGVKDSKSNMSIMQSKMDLIFHYTADRTTALVRMDVKNLGLSLTSSVTSAPGSTDTTVQTVGFAQALDDAWVQYAFCDTLNLKMGYTWAHNTYYGLHSWFDFSQRTNMDIAHGTPKLEVNGNFAGAGVSYGLMVWEDVKADPAESDNDALANMSLLVKAKQSMFEAGLIYAANPADKNNKTEKDATSYQLFGKYFIGEGLDAWLVYTQMPITSDEEGNTGIAVGVDYEMMSPIGIYLGIDQKKSKKVKSDTSAESKTGMIVDLKVDYKVNSNLKYFGQVINYGVDSSGNTEAYNRMIVGLQGNW